MVSVLIPSYNAGCFLPQALDSVLAQTYTDLEILVVDDGSEDDTAQVAARYPQVRYIRNEHRGISATRNLALSHARGELIAFLDADDLWLPEKLEKQVAYLAAHPECQLVFTEVKNFYDGDRANMTPRQAQLMDAKLEYALPTCCAYADLYRRYGGYREDYAYGEDTYWITRLRAAGVKMHHCIPEPLYLRRIHSGNISLTHRKVEQKDILTLMAQALRENRKGNRG